jgi:lysophospholipase L1-like esterase
MPGVTGETPPAPARRRRRLRRAFALLAAAVGIVLAVVVAEISLRLFARVGLDYEAESLQYFTTAIEYAWQELPPTPPPQLPAGLDLDGRLFWHKRGIDVAIGDFRVRTNAFGCRGPEIGEAKPDGVRRILMLGDSVAFGWGVDDDVTFVRRLEREWNDEHPDRRIEVVNSAVPKYDSNQEEATLRELGARLDPDLVLLVYVVNDIDPTRDLCELLLTGEVAHPEEQIAIPDDIWSSLQTRLQPVVPAIATLLGRQTDIAARVQQTLPAGQRYRPEQFGAGPRGWPRSQAALLRMRDWCQAKGVPFVVFDHTLPRIESLQPFCAENGIAYEPFWFDEQDLALGICNSWLDSHANARGHGLLLRRLRQALERRELLPR